MTPLWICTTAGGPEALGQKCHPRPPRLLRLEVKGQPELGALIATSSE